MSDFDVDTDGMNATGLSDADADALIAGRSVEGLPRELVEMMSAMREQATRGPTVPISGALTEFMIERTPSVTPIGAGATRARRRSVGPIAKKAAAAFSIVPAKMLTGATMAAAAVGGAQAFGIVDVPLLPGPVPAVVTNDPVETAPPPTAVVSSTLATASVASTTIAAASSSTSKATDMSDATVPSEVPANVPLATSPTTVPKPSAAGGTSGCDFGQETSGRPDRESNAEMPGRRPDATVNSVVPPIDPCARSGPDQTRPSRPIGTMPLVPADPSQGTGAPSSAPGKNGGARVDGAPAQIPADDPGIVSGQSNAAPNRAPNAGQGGSDAAGEGTASTDLQRNLGRERTPPGD